MAKKEKAVGTRQSARLVASGVADASRVSGGKRTSPTPGSEATDSSAATNFSRPIRTAKTSKVPAKHEPGQEAMSPTRPSRSASRAATKRMKASTPKADTDSDKDDFMSDPEPMERKPRKAPKSTTKKTITPRKTEPGMSRAQKEQMMAELPVITQPQAMFDDMVNRHEDFMSFVEEFKRPLRVATMCSGTESPLLALEMISQACKNHHCATFQVEHVFSCEIEPFKQGYIERNFAPPILFRDICELGGDKAFTAYGAQVDVPGDVDILVAGTSCVDYSNLNNKKQDIEAKGESGETFRGMMTWVEKHQPPIVILENVCSAPWAKVQTYFEAHGYSARFMRVDTKQYYIPHTRTRVYLVAFNQKACNKSADDLASQWVHAVKSMERPSSGTLEAFLLSSDDPRVHRGRERLAIPKERGTSGTDWSRCESRHQRARMDEGLGTKRPYTSWESQGACKLPDYAWSDWAKVQTERVLDLLDIDYLRLAAKDTDAAYKTLVWNLSQNVDRTTGSVRPGICPCLTPTMVPFVTNRGGPLIGLEALSLQGIPVDDLMLTRQTEDQMADLAGNAMTSTVVGTCMMAALTLAHKGGLLPKSRKGASSRKFPASVLDRKDVVVVGDMKLKATALELDSRVTRPLADLLQEASKSSQQCVCEGRIGMAKGIHKCQDCGATACQKCRGRPEHNYEGGLMRRVSPEDFTDALKAALPMRVMVHGISAAALERLKPEGVADKIWRGWKEHVEGLAGSEFCFCSVKRGQVWTALYSSPTTNGAKLELILDLAMPRWQVTIEPPTERGLLRDLLSKPVMRCKLDHDGGLMGGGFELFIPNMRTMDVKITGKGELVQAWQTSMGLKNEFETQQRWNCWKIEATKKDAAWLGVDLSGSYNLLNKCGHAANALHKIGSSSSGSNAMFFFLDPSRCGGPDTDHFVFASSHRRLAYDEDRGALAMLDPSWRPHSRGGSEQVPLVVPGVWRDLATTKITALASTGATVSAPAAHLGLNISIDACGFASAVLHSKVPLTEADKNVWPENDWKVLNLERSKATFDQIAWLTERLELPEALTDWNWASETPGDPVDVSTCQCCAPELPGMRWVYQKGKIVAREDPVQAAAYECQIKVRPSPFVVRLRQDTKMHIGELQIAVNSRTLVNRALAELSFNPEDDVSVSWRVVPHQSDSGLYKPGKFILKSNRHDTSASQPPHFKTYRLRPEQLRSLGWMLNQEKNTEPYIQEEVSEAILPALGWRAEGRAQKSSLTLGGVVADQVGYGKTALTIGLIDSSLGAALPQPADGGRSIPVKATLVLVPPHLMNQWPSEIEKFSGKSLKCETIKTVGDLARLTVKQIMEADVVVVASSILRSTNYYERLAHLSGCGEGLAKATKASHFADCYSTAMSNLGDQAEALQASDVDRVWQAVQQAKEAHAKDIEHAPEMNSKRLKGKQFREAKENGPGSQASAADKATDPETEAEEPTVPAPAKRRKGPARGRVTDQEASRPSPCAGRARRKPARVYVPEDVEDRMNSDSDFDSDSSRKPWTNTKSKTPKQSSKSLDHYDPWGLTSDSVQADWELLMSPPLEIFHWARVVVDEFTYLTNKDKVAIQNGLKASARWVLSGTPPHESFDDVKGIAAFLGIQLGCADGKPIYTKSEQTQAQTFQFYRDVHTQAWHKRRHSLAQTFLDRFLRQNIAEIDEIEQETTAVDVHLLPVERAIYLELDHHLQALEMKGGRRKMWNKKGPGGDRAERLRAALGSSDSAEEALLKRCAHFDLCGNSSTALKACQDIVDLRKVQLEKCKAELILSISGGFMQLSDIRQKDPNYGLPSLDDKEQDIVSFLRWSSSIEKGSHCEDLEATGALQECLAVAGAEWKPAVNKRAKGKSKQRDTDTVDEGEPTIAKSLSLDDKKWALREHTHGIRRLEKELVGRVRSLRYFEAILQLSHTKKATVSCPACNTFCIHPDQQGVLSSCGHTGCYKCLVACADRQECVQAGCKAAVRSSSVVHRQQLGIDPEVVGAGGRFGSKMKSLIQAIQSTPPSERILVFVQFKDLMQTVADALDYHKIPALQLQGTAHQKSNSLAAFQKEKFQKGDPKVLLLNVRDESASGANLTTANHAFFVHPLLVNSQQEYTACLTQAMGRVVRYGQINKVHIRHFLALDTMDTEIHAERHQA